MIILKMTNFRRRNLAVFHNTKKKKLRFIFLMTYLIFIFVNTDFFQDYIEIESKIFFIIFEIFGIEKQNIAILTFKQASITCRQVVHILHEPRNYRYNTLCELTLLV